jgi:hypothetical protein
MKKHMGWMVAGVAAVMCFLGTQGAWALTVAEGEKGPGVIYVKGDATGVEKEAAGELARVVGLMTGSAPSVKEVGGAGEVDGKQAGFVVGSLGGEMGVKMEQKSRAGDGFRYKAVGKKVIIVGENEQGVYTGVSRFLEGLGAGWYTPGKVGEVIPKLAKVEVADGLDVTGVSDSINRRFWYGGKGKSEPATAEWLKHMNGANYESGSWSHAYGHLIPKATLAEHPEYGSLFKGKRGTRQLCTTNPEVVKIGAQTVLGDMEKKDQLVFNAGPNDGGGLCECEACVALDTPGYVEPSSGKTNASDRIFLFASAIADITSKKFPNKDLGILVYSDYSRIPKKITKLNGNVFPMIAPIRRCRLHGPGNPECEMNKLWEEEIAGWSKVSPTKLGFYMYNYNLADAMFPLSKVDFYKRLTAQTTKLNVPELAWIFESIDAWSSHAPSLYLSARISWNSHLDIDAEMARFYKGFYGSAAVPMERYWKRIDSAIAGGKTHTGSSYGMHKIWSAQMLKDSRADIEEAKKLAKDEREKEAVAMAEAGLACAELYVEVWNAVAACDFVKAAAAQEKLAALSGEMKEGKHVPNWGHERYSYGYYKAFVGPTVASGEKMVKAGGAVVVKMPEVWKFATDEKLVGVGEGWFKPGFDTSKWKSMGTMSTSWVDEGMTWYVGDAWYQTKFTVPADAKGKDLRLWFGGFDSNVDVYLNGESVGEKKGFMKPQEFADVSKFLKFGEENVLTVRVSSGSLEEIGTGGIMMPVALYAAGKDAPTLNPPEKVPAGAAPAPKGKAPEKKPEEKKAEEKKYEM